MVASKSQTQPIIRADRLRLRDVLVAYMRGEISTFAFDDLNSAICDESADESARAVCEQLYLIHDDFINHPISVRRKTWNALLRVAAFLATDLVIRDESKTESWPFQNEEEWLARQSLVEPHNLPAYDPAVHAQSVGSPLRRIPTLVGLGIIAVAAGAMICAATAFLT